jgi:hypothetical protein
MLGFTNDFGRIKAMIVAKLQLRDMKAFARVD